MAVLDSQVQQRGGVASEGVGGITLRRLLVWTHDPRERLQMLAVLVDGCKRKLSTIYVCRFKRYSQLGNCGILI